VARRNLFVTVASTVRGASRLKRKLQSVAASLVGPAVVLRMEKILVNRTKRRFITKTDPRGVPWAPWKAGTEERRQRELKSGRAVVTAFGAAHSGILVLTGELANSIQVMRAGQNKGFGLGTGAGFRIGSTSPKARIHQMGLPSRNIPARKFLGITRRDSTAIERMLLRVARATGLR